MEQKLVFLDIDGTLVAPGEMQPPASAQDAIRRARARGHKVFLCTGRNRRMAEPLFPYGFDGYICSAGGYVVCDGTLLFDCPMEPAQSQGLRAALEQCGADYTLEVRDISYGAPSRILEQAMRRNTGDGMNSEAERWLKFWSDETRVRPLRAYQGEPIYKICYTAENTEQLAPVRALYEDQFVFCEQQMLRFSAGIVNGELINRKFNKGTGIQAICRALGASPADAIGFGDSENDLEMTDAVGISVCMANGSDALKKRCTRICPAVTEDGLAREFEALGLI
ncbi:MAG: HAD family hydrolase [Candidatus Faecalibacterium intestinavium]|uniref:HAD family hydrolase n=1 Tax=Candidatus Faecalibacterium intestinavium TaxID=2838580 RepID=A0A9E2KIX4_9FIRM|nr:HAD family hydrolase [Candidatus Faecalibacterium intestinavium]